MRTPHIKLPEATKQRCSVTFTVNGLRHDTPVRLFKLSIMVAATTSARCESNTRLSRGGSDCVCRRCYLRCRTAAPPKDSRREMQATHCNQLTRRGAAALTACHRPHAVRRTGAGDALYATHAGTAAGATHDGHKPQVAGPANSTVDMSRWVYSRVTQQPIDNSWLRQWRHCHNPWGRWSRSRRSFTALARCTSWFVAAGRRVYWGILQQTIHNGEMAVLALRPEWLRCRRQPGSRGRAVATNPQHTNDHTGLLSEWR